MVDFFQNGAITTLHALGDRPTGQLEEELTGWARSRPVALIIPCLASELDGPALGRIVDTLAEVPYLSEIVIGLDRADADQFAHARKFFAQLPQRHRILWNDGPRLRAIEEDLRAGGIGMGQPGKGRNVWWCLGLALASGRIRAVALHDADLANYSNTLLARLLYPVMHPTFGYVFAKGYYYRAADHQWYGRASRLLVTPLLRALRTMLGPNDYLEYLDGFRYPLAGEVALRAEAIPSIRVPGDWGLEIGVLGEVYRNFRPQQICQVDVAGASDHKHQELSGDDPSSGLHKMAIDVTKAVFRKLAVDGLVLSTEHFRTLRATYQRSALDLVDRYHDDAVMNGFRYDRHRELETVEVFARAVAQAGDQFLIDPLDSPNLASWARVRSAVPDVQDRMLAAVEADHRDSG